MNSINPKRLRLIIPLLVPVAHAATFEEVTTEGDNIGTVYVLDGNASTGGGDYNSINGPPESAAFDRTFLLAPPGGGGIDISLTGLAFGLPGGGNTNGNVITATITYLGADGVAGGADDVLIGSTQATHDFSTGAGRYEWLFDAPLVATIDGAGSNFRVRLESLETDNGGSTFNMRFKTSGGATAANTKMDVAGTSNSNGFVDADIDGIHDGFETNTGIYVSPFDTGTDPTNDDTDNDDLLDGVETNTGVYVSPSATGTDPLDDDTDNDGLLDGVETNTGIFASATDTGTDPFDRDTDNDALNDKFETDNGLDAFTNADFDNDTFSDRVEVQIYGSDPKDINSFPGDGSNPDVGSFTVIQDGGGSAAPGDFDIPSTLGSAIINEVATGGGDRDFATGITNFTALYDNAFPAAGSTVSLTGFAWVVTGSPVNQDGDILIQFFDPGADGVFDGVDQDTLVGSALGSLTTTGSTTVMYWNFDTPINFVSEGTALAVKISSSAGLRFKAQNNFVSAVWENDDGSGLYSPSLASRFSIGGTATAPAQPKILSITRIGTSTTLIWDLNGATSVDVERSTDLGATDPWTVVADDTTDTSYNETSPDTEAFFRLVSP